MGHSALTPEAESCLTAAGQAVTIACTPAGRLPGARVRGHMRAEHGGPRQRRGLLAGPPACAPALQREHPTTLSSPPPLMHPTNMHRHPPLRAQTGNAGLPCPPAQKEAPAPTTCIMLDLTPCSSRPPSFPGHRRGVCGERRQSASFCGRVAMGPPDCSRPCGVAPALLRGSFASMESRRAAVSRLIIGFLSTSHRSLNNCYPDISLATLIVSHARLIIS